jgi:hypothetical protein
LYGAWNFGLLAKRRRIFWRYTSCLLQKCRLGKIESGAEYAIKPNTCTPADGGAFISPSKIVSDPNGFLAADTVNVSRQTEATQRTWRNDSSANKVAAKMENECAISMPAMSATF